MNGSSASTGPGFFSSSSFFFSSSGACATTASAGRGCSWKKTTAPVPARLSTMRMGKSLGLLGFFGGAGGGVSGAWSLISKLRVEDDVHAAVARAAFDGVVAGDGLVLAVTGGRQSVR